MSQSDHQESCILATFQGPRLLACDGSWLSVVGGLPCTSAASPSRSQAEAEGAVCFWKQHSSVSAPPSGLQGKLGNSVDVKEKPKVWCKHSGVFCRVTYWDFIFPKMDTKCIVTASFGSLSSLQLPKKKSAVQKYILILILIFILYPHGPCAFFQKQGKQLKMLPS